LTQIIPLFDEDVREKLVLHILSRWSRSSTFRPQIR